MPKRHSPWRHTDQVPRAALITYLKAEREKCKLTFRSPRVGRLLDHVARASGRMKLIDQILQWLGEDVAALANVGPSDEDAR